MLLILSEVKEWLRIDGDEEDDLISNLIHSAESYLLTATGRRSFGSQTPVARLLCQYLITHWYEDRSFYNPTPNTIKAPIITMMMTQLQYGGDVDGDNQ